MTIVVDFIQEKKTFVEKFKEKEILKFFSNSSLANSFQISFFDFEASFNVDR